MPRDAVIARILRRANGDRGSMIPMIILAFTVAGLIITGSIAAGSAFLAQRDLQSVCDGAAIAAAQALDDIPYYRNGVGSYSALPLGDVQHAVDSYASRERADSGRLVDMRAGVTADGVTVAVSCSDHVNIPFQGIFRPGELDRHASASARAETQR